MTAVFGDVKHMPKYADVPEEFKRDRNAYVRFVSNWFFNGMSNAERARLTPKEGVDAMQAFRAIKTILVSFEPKHEHKEAGAAYLLSQWFDLAPEKPAERARENQG